jgi:hypothetical protein
MIIIVEYNGTAEVVINRFENFFNVTHEVLRSQTMMLDVSEKASDLEPLVKRAKNIIIAGLRWGWVGAVDLGIVLVSVIEFAPYLGNLLAQIFSLFQQ